jgi:palmitoyltransferase ZDHHC9/14/18
MSFANNDDEAIPQSSGVTSNSTAPILKEQQNWVYKDRPFRNYQLHPSHNRFLLGGRLVTSKDFRAFIAALFLLITPVVLFIVFT